MKKENRVPKNRKMLGRAIALRKNMTRHEKRLWYDFLRFYPVKFYKQRIIDSYIVDFYCDSAKLAIEVDGSQHETEDGVKHDAIRTEQIEKYNVTVLRIPNIMIDRDFSLACYAIDETVQKLLKNASSKNN